MRILLIGCVKSTEVVFNKLCEMEFDLVGVVTKEESNYNSDFCDIGKLAHNRGIDVFYTKKANDNATVEYIKSRNPDIILCIGWSELLDNRILTLPPKGCIGFHPAKLPYNRGRHPIIWALALGLAETASTLFFMDEGADTGDILSQVNITISYEDNATSLYDKIMQVLSEQIGEILKSLEQGNEQRIKQNANEGNSWRKRSKPDGKIDFRMTSTAIYNLVRALTTPYPGAYFEYKGEEISVWSCRETEEENIENIEPGKIIRGSDKGNPVIKTGKGCIELIETGVVNLVEGEYL